MKREPVVIIGAIVTAVLGIGAALDVIDPSVIEVIAPVITSSIARFFVTPVAAPSV